MNFSKEFKITKVKSAEIGATTVVNSDTVDMQGYEGVIFFTTMGTANAGNYLKVQQGDVSNLSDAADLGGAKVVATADSEVIYIDLYKPEERYVRASVVRGVSTAVGDIYAIQYEGRTPAQNEITDVIAGALLISPDAQTVA